MALIAGAVRAWRMDEHGRTIVRESNAPKGEMLMIETAPAQRARDRHAVASTVGARRMGNESAPSSTAAPANDEPAVWRAFAEATTAQDFYRGWLGVQCRLVAGVRGGVIVGVSPDSTPSATPLAVWGKDPRVSRALIAATRQALARRRRVLVQQETDSGRAWKVAFPVQAQGRVVAAVALDLAPRSAREFKGALRQIEWGSGWLEALALR